MSEKGEKRVEEENLSEVIEALKESIAELKSAINDLTGPMSPIQPSEQKRASISQVKREGPPPAEANVAKAEKELSSKKEAPAPGKEDRSAKEQLVQFKEITLRDSIKILKLLYALSEKVPSEIIDDYISLFKMIGVGNEITLEATKKINEIVQKGLKSGIPLQEQLMSIYVLAKTFGITDSELENEFMNMLLENLKKKDK